MTTLKFIKDFNRRPFNYLPLNNGDLFDLTCEYAISIFERVDLNSEKLFEQAEDIRQKLPNAELNLYKTCFWLVDTIIDDYSKLIKCSKLSLGQNEGQINNPTQVFENFSYSPNTALQTLIIRGIRNTAQHFEERLQVYHQQIDPFLKLAYRGQNFQWEIEFGKGGYHHRGGTNGHEEGFNKEKLYFHSYQKTNGNLVNQDIKLVDILRDIMEIQKSVEENMEDYINRHKICCPPTRGLSIFMISE